MSLGSWDGLFIKFLLALQTLHTSVRLNAQQRFSTGNTKNQQLVMKIRHVKAVGTPITAVREIFFAAAGLQMR
jgi:hypothetical protein